MSLLDEIDRLRAQLTEAQRDLEARRRLGHIDKDKLDRLRTQVEALGDALQTAVDALTGKTDRYSIDSMQEALDAAREGE